MTTIVCVIPAFNEEDFIGQVISTIPEIVEHIIVVDDASTDQTVEVVRAATDSRVILARHEENQGVGGAVLTGYQRALEIGAEIVVKIDGDGQMDAAEISRLTRPIRDGSADYTKGVRFRDLDVVRQMPITRLIGNLALSFLTKAASGYWHVFDPANGFTAIRSSLLKELDRDRLSRGFFFESDMLCELYFVDACVVDVSIRARYGDESSTLRPARVLLTFPFQLLRRMVRRVMFRYFVMDFTAVSALLISGGSLFSFGFVFGAYKWSLAFGSEVPTPTGTVMLAVLPMILGFQLLLQALVLDIQNVPSKSSRGRL